MTNIGIVNVTVTKRKSGQIIANKLDDLPFALVSKIQDKRDKEAPCGR